jgi:hypothetical protein
MTNTNKKKKRVDALIKELKVLQRNLWVKIRKI